jgi:hypothetical protein
MESRHFGKWKAGNERDFTKSDNFTETFGRKKRKTSNLKHPNMGITNRRKEGRKRWSLSCRKNLSSIRKDRRGERNLPLTERISKSRRRHFKGSCEERLSLADLTGGRRNTRGETRGGGSRTSKEEENEAGGDGEICCIDPVP